MVRRYSFWLFVLALLLGTACERVKKYPPQPASPSRFDHPAVAEDPVRAAPVAIDYGWLEPQNLTDIPIRFVHSSSDEWSRLDRYWNPALPTTGAGLPALGIPPLEAALAWAVQMKTASIRIKVPLGLPDPTSHIPSSNPPAYGPWLLGKKLFFDDNLLQQATAGNIRTSCANCHDPEHHFTVKVAVPARGYFNVPTLLNSVYNRHQFWDGRVGALEEVLIRQLDDERMPAREPDHFQTPPIRHAWPGVISGLRGKADYVRAFQSVYGRDATADLVAKALATYMRTLLSGNSVYDRADNNRQARRAADLEAVDFETALSPDQLKKLALGTDARQGSLTLLRGWQLFSGEARCSMCHPAPLFTDGKFHNTGIGDSVIFTAIGNEKGLGRFGAVSYGLKQKELVGAYKTPALRDVSVTGPYMHDGSLPDLKSVLVHYSTGLDGNANHYLDQVFLDRSGKAWQPRWSPTDVEALQTFLRSLRGADLPDVLTSATNKIQ